MRLLCEEMWKITAYDSATNQKMDYLAEENHWLFRVFEYMYLEINSIFQQINYMARP